VRILTVCTSTRIFGTEIATLNLLAAFQRKGFEQLAVTSKWTDGKFSERLRALGITDIAFPMGAFGKPRSLRAISWTLTAAAHAPKLWLGWGKVMEKFQPDILLLTSPKQGMWVYPWLKKQPSFLVEHGMKAVNGANRWMYQRLQRNLHGFVAVSRFMKQHLEELGVDPKLVQIIYSYCQSPSPKVRPKSESNGTFRIGIVGQISPHKGHDRLLDVSIILKKRGIDFEILVFGDGPPDYVTLLRQKIRSGGLEKKWKWMGYVSAPEEIYGSMHLCVVPSCFDEPFGLVAIEAASFGLPVIAAPRVGLPEIVIDGKTGFLVDPSDAMEFAEKITLLANDGNMAATIGATGRERVLLEFSEQKMIEGYESLFHNSARFAERSNG
jgi:glycosyltransferase involved in cell wall biosynthesis